MILNDSFQQQTDFDIGRNINVFPISDFISHHVVNNNLAREAKKK